jgi:hypothetical protein
MKQRLAQLAAAPLDARLHGRHRNPCLSCGIDLGLVPEISGEERLSGYRVEMHDQRANTSCQFVTSVCRGVCRLSRQAFGQGYGSFWTTVVINDGIGGDAVHPAQRIPGRLELILMHD